MGGYTLEAVRVVTPPRSPSPTALPRTPARPHVHSSRRGALPGAIRPCSGRSGRLACLPPDGHGGVLPVERERFEPFGGGRLLMQFYLRGSTAYVRGRAQEGARGRSGAPQFGQSVIDPRRPAPAASRATSSYQNSQEADEAPWVGVCTLIAPLQPWPACP